VKRRRGKARRGDPVRLVHLVSSVQAKKPDRPNEQDRHARDAGGTSELSLAERVGIEPTVPLPGQQFSRPIRARFGGRPIPAYSRRKPRRKRGIALRRGCIQLRWMCRVRELTVTKKVTLTGMTKKDPSPRYPKRIRPQGVRGEVSVYYIFFARLVSTRRGGY